MAGVTYDLPQDATVAMVQELIEDFHSELYTYNVKVGVIMAHAPTDKDGVRKGPALKQFKVETPSLTNIVGLKDRLKKEHDVEITLDHDIWEEATLPRRYAILDQALTRVETVKKDGEVQFDDFERPKLKIRDYTYVYYGFDEVAERQSINSLEFNGFQKMKTQVCHS